MSELTSPLTLLLLLNSTLTTALILNQNDSGKDTASNQSSNFSSNPLEKFTWICLIIQLILLLIKTKITDF
jgi:hypothetical protein